MKKLRVFVTILVVLVIVVWLAGGPVTRALVRSKADQIMAKVSEKSEGNITVARVSGDLWSGITFERVVVLADNNPAHLPLLTADRVVVGISFADLFRREITVRSIHIADFTAVLHISEDGEVAWPQWDLDLARRPPSVIAAGIVGIPDDVQGIHITCENGILEIHKRFPRLTEPVDVVFTNLEGSAEYVEDDGVYIESITGDYLAAPVTIEGFYPKGHDRPVELQASLGGLELGTIFNDIDPLFRGSRYLPSGRTDVAIVLAGDKSQLAIGGAVSFDNITLGNVTVDHANASFSYSTGVVELSNISAQTYGGALEGSGRVNLLSEKPIWNATCSFESVDVPAYLDSNGYYSYEVEGGFSGRIEARGDFANAEALECSLEISCWNGRFLTPFSSRFLSLVRQSPEENPITDSDLAGFSELTVRAAIRNKTIAVQEFHFLSDDLQVEASGVIGFDKTIYARGGLSVPLDRARNHPRFGVFVRLLPDSINRATLEFSISGRLFDLRFDARVSDNLLRGIVDQGSDLFHGLGDSFTPPDQH